MSRTEGAEEQLPDGIRAIDVVRRGIRRTPEIRRPLALSIAFAISVAVGRLAVPILVQQVLDRGLLGPEGYQPEVVWSLSVVAFLIIAAVAVIAPIAEAKMATGANSALYELRRQMFAHIHRLSLVAHSEERRGTLLARVTSDIDAVSQFVEWGAVVWPQSIALIIGAVVVMFVYSWQLALIAVAALVVVLPLVRWLQVRQLRAHDELRNRVAELLGEYDEIIAGSASVRTYGYQTEARHRLERAIVGRYRADVRVARYYSVMFTVGDLASALAITAAAFAAITWGPEWGLEAGVVVSFFFLVTLVQHPISELTEVLDQTQRAVAGWNKVLTMLDIEPELTEPERGTQLPTGPLAVELDHVDAAYGTARVLHDVALRIEPGTNVAVVGETGSGKTTFARLLCRLLDPADGVVRLGGQDLGRVDPDSRHRAVRLVPQDGFLFDTTVVENVMYGRPGATRADVEAAAEELGLAEWVRALPQGFDTPVGARGEQLSVGERQLVALLRAQVTDPGLLILDEATSSVDPRTEQSLAMALDHLAADRTMVSIAHRLSTAERADLVLVFDQGRLVETGAPDDLKAAGGRYAALSAAWQRTVAAS